MLTDETRKTYTKGPAKSIVVEASPNEKVYTATFANNCTASIRVPALSFQLKWEGFSLKTKTPVVPTNVNGDAYDFTTNPAIDLTGKTYKLELSLDKVCPGTVRWNADKNLIDPIDTKAIFLTNSPVYQPGPTNINGNYAAFAFPSATTTYSAACHIANADGSETIYPASNTKTVIVPTNDCIRVDQDVLQLNRGQPVTLTTYGCLGEVSWWSGTAALGIGNTLTHTPLPVSTGAADYGYKVVCSNPVCTQIATVTVNPCRLLITGQKPIRVVGDKFVQEGVTIAQPITLQATGCEGGNLEWSTGETGVRITVKPLETSQYTATCRVNGSPVCSANAQITVDTTPPDAIVCPDFTLSASPCSIVSCTGQLVTVTPSGCPAGSQISWGDGLVTAPDNVRDFTVKQATTLKATCTTPYQIKAMAEIAISETKPELSVSPFVVYKGFPATLSAFGCFTSDCREGTYTWKKPRSSEPAQTGSSIRVNLTGPTDYEVTCNQVTKRVTIETRELDCDFSIAPSYRSTGTATLIADQCDVDRRMSWIFLENSNGVGTPYADDVLTITVSRPTTTANGYVDTYVVNCFKGGVPCKGVAFVRAPTTGGTNEGGSNPFPPGDACEGLSGDETKTAESPNYTWYLYSSWCPGRVSWYGDADRTKLVAALLKGERYSVGQIKTAVTYYYDCSLRDGTLCQGRATLKPASTNARLAANDASCSPVVKTNTCSGQISLAVASAVFYEKMLCQLSNLVQTREDAIALLSNLQSQLSGTGLVFPADPSALIDALANGQCEQAAKLLADANGQTLIDNQTFNEQINGQFGDIEESLLAKYKPFLIAQSVHRKGRNNDNTSSAADLAYCDMSPSQMIPINPEVSDWL